MGLISIDYVDKSPQAKLFQLLKAVELVLINNTVLPAYEPSPDALKTGAAVTFKKRTSVFFEKLL